MRQKGEGLSKGKNMTGLLSNHMQDAIPSGTPPLSTSVLGMKYKGEKKQNKNQETRRRLTQHPHVLSCSHQQLNNTR